MSHARHFTPNRTSDGLLTDGQRSRANELMDAHVAAWPQCRGGDVCVHPGLLWTSYYCTACERTL